jgi:uncharacterized membrane protein
MRKPKKELKRKSEEPVSFFTRIRRFIVTTFIGGLVVILPLTLFIFLLRLVVKFTAKLLAPIRSLIPFSENISSGVLDLLSLSIVVTLFFFVGIVVKTSVGGRLFSRFEQRWLMHLPLYGVLRETVRQFLGRKKTPFSQVVLVDAFGSGVLMTGFVTDDEVGGGYVTVFVPTAPNPTNGFVFHIKREKLQYVDTRPEDAMSSIIGVGTGSSSLFTLPKQPLKKTESE